MKIYEMTATFGKLDGATLTLADGLNIITAGNEWGKSTWCAFVTAMLYGIDTRERSGKENLADKERYQPWSGKSMEGRIRLEYRGRDITIERRSKGRIPMGEFRAYETESGLPIRELTAENCGQKLLGVEKSVFLRSGFIRQKDMPVTQDEALRRRLNALVTMAEESDAQDRLGQKLRELKNRCRYNRSGLIPQAQDRLVQLEEQLQERQLLQRRLREAQQEEEKLRQRLSGLENHQQWLTYNASRQDTLRVEQARQKLDTIHRQTEQLQAKCAQCPPREELEQSLSTQRPAEQPSRKMPRPSGWICGMVCALATGAVLAVLERYIGAVCAAVLAAVCAAGAVLAGRKKKQLLSQQEAQKAVLAAQDRQREQWLSQLHARQELERCALEEEQARQHLLVLEEMLRPAEKPDRPDELALTSEQTAQEVQSAQQRLRQLQLLQGQCRGRMEGLPEEDALQKQIGQTRTRLEELERTYTALGYAQKALEEATQQMQKRFAPRINRRAQELFSRLTLGRYDRISLAEDLSLTAASKEELTQRPALWRSDGTADQMYLALRLAVWEELMPEGILILDDALVRFDDDRLNSALGILEELSMKNQIILFTCQTREQETVDQFN